jgi:YVTN family beta-propeller protein
MRGPLSRKSHRMSTSMRPYRAETKSASRLYALIGCAAFAMFGLSAAQAAPFAYFANHADGTVSVLDAATHTSVATLTVGSRPIGVTMVGTNVYVANYGDGTVSVIDTTTNTVGATPITVGSKPELLAPSPDGKSIYVANLGDSTVSIIDTASGTAANKITLSSGSYPVGVAVSPTGNRLYVTDARQAKLMVVDTAAKSVTTTVAVGINPLGVAVNPAGTFAYVTNYGNDTVSVVDTSSNAVVATVAVGAGPDGIAINNAGTYAYVVNELSGSVSVISTASNTVVAAMPVDPDPIGIALDSDNTYAYVSSSVNANVSVIDLTANVVNGTITTGVGPGYGVVTSSAALAVNLNQRGLTGSWYNPSTSGQGFEIEVFPDSVSAGHGSLGAGWFTYDTTAAGGSRWYSLQGDVMSATPTANLTIYASTGGNFNAAPAVSGTAVGTATLRFLDCTRGVFTYHFTDGSNRSGSVALTRIGPNTTCGQAGDNGAAPSNFPLSGSWYNPATSGQGLILDVNPAVNLLAAGWFTYAPNGSTIGGGASQRWYSLQTTQFVPGMHSVGNVPIYETTGGLFNAPSTVTTTQVGTATVAFQSCSAATLAYSFTGGANQGLSGTINLSRVGATPAGCSF